MYYVTTPKYDKKKTIFLTCDEDIRDLFDLGSSRILLYIDDAGDDVGIKEIPEPIPKFRAIITKIFRRFSPIIFSCD